MREGTSHLARRHSESESTLTTAPQRERFDRAQDTFSRRDSESASTRAISAKSSPSSRHIRTAPQRVRFDTRNLRRGFAELKTHSRGATARALRHARSSQRVKTHLHGATARALRHERSPQRVRRVRDTFAPRHSESRRAQETFARRHSESASTRAISADGSPSSRQIRTAPLRERFDTHDLRRGCAELETNSHGATSRALRHARSPQRVHFRLAMLAE